MNSRVMPKNLQIETLSSLFVKLNGAADPEEVDWSHEIDETLSLPENRVELSIVYPGYQWFNSEDERTDVKAEADEDLSGYLSYLVSSVAEEVRPQLLEVFTDYRKRFTQGITRRSGVAALKRQVRELRDQLAEQTKTQETQTIQEGAPIVTETIRLELPSKKHKRTVKELAEMLHVPLYEQVGDKCKMCGAEPFTLYKAEAQGIVDWEWRCVNCDQPYNSSVQARFVTIHLPMMKPVIFT